MKATPSSRIQPDVQEEENDKREDEQNSAILFSWIRTLSSTPRDVIIVKIFHSKIITERAADANMGKMAYLGPNLEFSMLSIRKNDSKMIVTDFVQLDDIDLIGNGTRFMISRGGDVIEDIENVTATAAMKIVESISYAVWLYPLLALICLITILFNVIVIKVTFRARHKWFFSAEDWLYMSMAIASLIVEGVLVIEVLVRMLLDLTNSHRSDGMNNVLTEITICVIQVGINYCFLLPSGIFAIKSYRVAAVEISASRKLVLGIFWSVFLFSLFAGVATSLLDSIGLSSKTVIMTAVVLDLSFYAVIVYKVYKSRQKVGPQKRGRNVALEVIWSVRVLVIIVCWTGLWWCPLIFYEENPLNVCHAKHSQTLDTNYSSITENKSPYKRSNASSRLSTDAPAPAVVVTSTIRDCQMVYLIILAIFSCTFFVYIVACRRFRNEFGRMLQALPCFTEGCITFWRHAIHFCFSRRAQRRRKYLFTIFQPPAFVTGRKTSSNSRKSSAMPLPVMTKEEYDNLPKKAEWFLMGVQPNSHPSSKISHRNFDAVCHDVTRY